MPLPTGIKTPDDLLTPKEKTVIGFLIQSRIKRSIAKPAINKATSVQPPIRNLIGSGTLSNTIVETFGKKPQIRAFVLTSLGLSEKAKSHISDDALTDLLRSGLREFIGMNATTFVEEITARFFLTRGGGLGGTVRNRFGRMAHQRLVKSICSSLTSAKKPYKIMASEGKAKSIVWKDRAIFFDVTPFLGKNIDVVVVKAGNKNRSDLLRDPSVFLGCGELKGGVDPAGADEHWKTAAGALERIREGFTKRGLDYPPIFFLGYSIEKAMAKEIFDDLEKDKLY